MLNRIIKKYKLWCTVDKKWVYKWSMEEPIFCPENMGHPIDASMTSVEDEIKDMIAESSEAVARQEIYGEFLDEDASVLIDESLVDQAIAKELDFTAYRSAAKIMGIDVGWANDPTIVCKRQGLKIYPLIFQKRRRLW